MKIERRDFAPHVVRTGWTETNGTRVSLVVHFGLHHIKGNPKPYFSVTATGYENGRDSFGGCCHDIIAERFPELVDIVALHLSDIDGSPTHAEANGFYWLAGIVDMGQEHHGGNGSPARSAMQCAQVLADHLRITQDEAIKLAGRINKRLKSDGRKAARLEFAEYVDAQRPRWKREADAVIRKYELGIYGDMRRTPAELVATI